MEASDFKIDDRVKYIPFHANGDENHSDCEEGDVSSQNGIYVFVVFDGNFNSQACYPDTLKKL